MKKTFIIGISVFFLLSGAIYVSISRNSWEGSDVVSDTKRDYKIFCIGDSLTVGGEVNYPAELQEKLPDNYNVYNYGACGENTEDIAARVGGKQLLVSNFIIPADNETLVEVELKNDNFRVFGTGNGSLNPVTICGVKGEISNNFDGIDLPSELKHYFKRIESGNEVIVPDDTVVNTNISNDDCDILVIWCGVNDYANMDDKIIKSNIDSIINNYNVEKYIVIGITHNEGYKKINKSLSWHYRKHFLDISTLLCFDDGSTFPEYKLDEVHFNEKGYKLVAEEVYKKGLSLGYFE